MIEPRAVAVIGRVLIAALFVISGVSKIMAPAGAMGFMATFGVPALLLWPTILLEVGGGIALAVGFHLRFVAPALGIFTIIAASIFHHNFSDQMQRIMFLKDIGIAGGIALAWAFGHRSVAE